MKHEKQLSKVLLVLLTFFLWSCNKEEKYVSKQEKEIKREVQLSEIPHLMNSIQKKQQDGLLSKNAGDYLSLINTEKIIQITQNDGSKTYTFSLNLYEIDTLTNLVVKENGNGFDYHLVKYSSSELEKWKVAIANREIPDVEVTIENISIDGYSSGGGCYEIGYSCPSGWHNSLDELDSCEYSYYQWSVTTLSVPCDVAGGGGGGGGGGSPNPPPAPDPYTEPVIPTPLSLAIANYIANLSPEQSAWWNAADGNIKSDIVFYLNQNIKNDVIRLEAKLFINWAINYLINNPNVSWAQFQNWFMSHKADLEDTGSSNLSSLNLNFPLQTLPSLDNFILVYPSELDPNFDTPQKIYTIVGGAVLTKYNQGARNTCALRVSRALNNCNINIPNIPGVTVKGADNKNYFLVAKNLLYWMKKTFGTPTGSNHLTGSQGGTRGENFINYLRGKEGIYIMVPNDPSSAGFDASGHADLFFSDICDNDCYFNATGGVSEIFFWELP